MEYGQNHVSYHDAVDSDELLLTEIHICGDQCNPILAVVVIADIDRSGRDWMLVHTVVLPNKDFNGQKITAAASAFL